MKTVFLIGVMSNILFQSWSALGFLLQRMYHVSSCPLSKYAVEIKYILLMFIQEVVIYVGGSFKHWAHVNYTFITFLHSHTKTLNQKFRLKYCYIGTTIKRDNHQGCVAASCTVAGLFFGSEERPESREERLLAAIKGYRGSPTVRSLTSKICVFLSFADWHKVELHN